MWPDHLLLKPQREVSGVSDHPQQIGRVDLFVLFGPDATDQLGRLHGPAGVTRWPRLHAQITPIRSKPWLIVKVKIHSLHGR